VSASDAPETSTALRLPSYWQRESTCLLGDPASNTAACPSAGTGDYIPLGNGRIRHFFWSGFQGPGTGGVGSALSEDGGLTFTVEPGLRIASSGVTGDPDFNVDQSVVFERTDGSWGLLVGQYDSAEHASGPTGIWLYTSSDKFTFTAVGPAFGQGSATEGQLAFVGRGKAFRPTPNGPLRGLFTCNLANKPAFGEPASDVCATVSTDEGASWQFDVDPDLAPWRSADKGKTWHQDDQIRDGIVIIDGNEAYVFPITGGFGLVFTYLVYGVYVSTSSDGVHWSAPTRADVRNADGTSCFYADPNGDGAYFFAEDENHNCEPGDPVVFQRADGTLVLANAQPGKKDGTGGGFYGWVGTYE
jgi:hypothetical protein